MLTHTDGCTSDGHTSDKHTNDKHTSNVQHTPTLEDLKHELETLKASHVASRSVVERLLKEKTAKLNKLLDIDFTEGEQLMARKRGGSGDRWYPCTLVKINADTFTICYSASGKEEDVPATTVPASTSKYPRYRWLRRNAKVGRKSNAIVSAIEQVTKDIASLRAGNLPTMDARRAHEKKQKKVRALKNRIDGIERESAHHAGAQHVRPGRPARPHRANEENAVQGKDCSDIIEQESFVPKHVIDFYEKKASCPDQFSWTVGELYDPIQFSLIIIDPGRRHGCLTPCPQHGFESNTTRDGKIPKPRLAKGISGAVWFGGAVYECNLCRQKKEEAEQELTKLKATRYSPNYISMWYSFIIFVCEK